MTLPDVSALMPTVTPADVSAALMPTVTIPDVSALVPTFALPDTFTAAVADLERLGQRIADDAARLAGMLATALEAVTAERDRRRRLGRDALIACDRRRALIAAGLEAVAPLIHRESTPPPTVTTPTEATAPVPVLCTALEAVGSFTATPNGPPASALISSTPTDTTGRPTEP
jgi:hypothetical protein